MAYLFKKNEPIPHAIRRVFAEEIALAVGQLLHSRKRTQAVHEARKSIKKIRGLLDLIATRLGSHYKTEDRYFRNAANHLSELRDTTVMLEVFDALAAKLDPADAAPLAEVRLNLLRSQREAPPEKHAAAEVARLLREAQPHAQSWPLDNLDWNGLLPDLTSVYRKGRNALKSALREKSPESVHNFRKQVKRHWYHVRLLESVCDSELKKRAAALHDLETCLGDKHNFDVLRARLESDLETSRDRHQARHFMALLHEESEDLQTRALSAGAHLYAQKPAAFCETLAAGCTPVPKRPGLAPSQLRVGAVVA
jgi:CHAD domain-containing protein